MSGSSPYRLLPLGRVLLYKPKFIDFKRQDAYHFFTLYKHQNLRLFKWVCSIFYFGEIIDRL